MFSRRSIIIALLVLGVVYGWYNILPQPTNNKMVNNNRHPSKKKLHDILKEPRSEDDFMYFPNFKTEIAEKNLIFEQLIVDYDE